jgi:hypothetical protein
MATGDALGQPARQDANDNASKDVHTREPSAARTPVKTPALKVGSGRDEPLAVAVCHSSTCLMFVKVALVRLGALVRR